MVRELIAILRGVAPHEAVAIAEELILSGITKIEVPLNSPKAYESIENIANHFSGEAIIGASSNYSFARKVICYVLYTFICLRRVKWYLNFGNSR